MKLATQILLFLFSFHLSSQGAVISDSCSNSNTSSIILGFDEYTHLCPGFRHSEMGGNEEESACGNYLKSNKELCRYAPKNIVDGNISTAWVEASESGGIGDEVIVPRLLDVNRPVEIWAGYGKSEALFYANNRPRKLRVCVLSARGWGNWVDPHDMSQTSHGYSDLTVVATHTVELKDINDYQPLELPDFSVCKYKDFPEEYYYMDGTDLYFYEKNLKEGKREPYKKKFWDYAYFLKLKTLDIYKGTKYDDTCISEIKN